MKQEPVVYNEVMRLDSNHVLNFQEPNTITFNSLNSDWVMRITADRKIEVNEDVEVSEAAQTVLNAVQELLNKQKPQYRELSDEDRLAFTKAYFNIHPEAHLSEQFKIKLYELNDFARAILKKARKE